MKEENTWGGRRPGAGRPSQFKGQKTRMNIGLTEEALQKLNEISAKTGVSRSDIINELILNDRT